MTVTTCTVAYLCELYMEHAQSYYRRADGSPSREHYNIRAAVGRFVNFAGRGAWAANDITSQTLIAWRDQLIAEMVKVGGIEKRRLSRSYINTCVDRLRGMFRWGVSQGLVSPLVTESLRCIMPLRRFRSDARETVKHVPPELEEIERITTYLTNTPRHVLQILKLTNARPTEILALRHCEVVLLDRHPRLTPGQHKGAWRGRPKVIPLVPEAAAILEGYHKPLLPEGFVFESTWRGKNGRRGSAGGHYTLRALQRALQRACVRAGVPPCVPYDIRRAGARRVRRRSGLDSAQAILGHSRQSTTEIYAPLNPEENATFLAALAAAECLRPEAAQARDLCTQKGGRP